MKIYILTRAELLCPLCYEIPCKFSGDIAFLSRCRDVHDLGIDMKKEKSHSCDQCDEKFEWLSHLKRHIKSVHDGLDEDDFKEEG